MESSSPVLVQVTVLGNERALRAQYLFRYYDGLTAVHFDVTSVASVVGDFVGMFVGGLVVI